MIPICCQFDGFICKMTYQARDISVLPKTSNKIYTASNYFVGFIELVLIRGMYVYTHFGEWMVFTVLCICLQ